MDNQFDTLESNAAAALQSPPKLSRITAWASDIFPGTWSMQITTTHHDGNETYRTITELTAANVVALTAQELASE